MKIFLALLNEAEAVVFGIRRQFNEDFSPLSKFQANILRLHNFSRAKYDACVQ
ncbi:MAG: hypothetical protein QXI67_07435 [Candidatus Bathyarchaeia archaeon]